MCLTKVTKIYKYVLLTCLRKEKIMEKKKCIIYGFAVLSALTGMAFTESIAALATEVNEEPIPVVENEVVEDQIVSPELDEQVIATDADSTSTVIIESEAENGQEINNQEVADQDKENNSVVIDETTVSIEEVSNLITEEVEKVDEIKVEEDQNVKETELIQGDVEKTEDSFALNTSTLTEAENENLIAPYVWIDNEYGYGWIENNKLVFYLNGEKYSEKDIVNNAWNEINVNGTVVKYYVKDNQLVYGIQMIDGNAYYFDGNGELIRDSWNSYWDYDTETSYGIYADSNGLLQKGWIITEYDKYYFGNDYKGLSGLQIIDGNKYYLNLGKLQTNFVVLDNGVFYHFNEEGILNKQETISGNQWIKVDDDYYYVKDNQLVENKLLQIGNSTYGFGYNGKMYRDNDFWIDGDSYRADKNGALITGWYQREGWSNVYYYGSDYKAVKGIQNIDGKNYVFNNYGDLRKDSVAMDYDNKKAYVGDTNGIHAGTIDCQKNGWTQCEGNWYYVENNDLISSGVKKINNTLYAFYNYKMLDNTVGYTWDENNYGMVQARPGGALVVSNWGTNGYYFGADGFAVEGYQKIGNDYYFFDSYGVLMKNNLVNIEGSQWIRVDESGKQIASFNTTTNGWKSVANGDWAYVENNQVLKNTLKTIGKSKYYLDYNGLMMRNQMHLDSNIQETVDLNPYIYFGDDGAAVKGWIQRDGHWYYYDNNFYGIRGIKTINNVVYAFDNSSAMRMKVILPSKDGTVYSFDAKGVGTKISPAAGFYMNKYYINSNHKAVSGWQYIDKNWYYFDLDTKEMTGAGLYGSALKQIDGKYYIFNYDGKMITGWTHYGNRYARSDGSIVEDGWIQINGSWYYFKDTLKQSGAIVDSANNKYVLNKAGNQYQLVTQKNGWVGFKNEWFYLENGDFIRGNVKIINGQTYGFDANGFMLKNTEYLAYYFDNDGHAFKNQWLEVRPKTWRYYDENGVFVSNGWKTIGNAKYYFGSNGIIKTADTVIDGELCKFSSSGALIGIPTKLKNGWNLVDGYWYYSNNGTLYQHGMYTIGKKDYYFSNGKMAMNEIIHTGQNGVYFATKDGSIAKNRWCGSQSQYYAQADGQLKTGPITSSGKQYYITQYTYEYIRDTSALDTKENKVYIADKNGVIVQTLDAKNLNGWIKGVNKAYYLVLNHQFVTGFHESGNKLYWMSATTGIMAENSIVGLEDVDTVADLGYADANGSISTNGWVENAYFINGMAMYGPRKIDGKDYYFENKIYLSRPTGGGIGIGENTPIVYKDLDGSYYYFNGKGNKEKLTFKDGWNQYKGEWYYKGDFVSNYLTKINGSYYVFGAFGKMVTNHLVWDSIYSDYSSNGQTIYYVDGNGNLAKGWQYVNNNWYYFGDDYKAVKGIRKIDGKEYCFDSNGVMV